MVDFKVTVEDALLERTKLTLRYSKLSFIISLFVLIINLSITSLFGYVIYEKYTSITAAESLLGQTKLPEIIK